MKMKNVRRGPDFDNAKMPSQDAKVAVAGAMRLEKLSKTGNLTNP